MRHVAASHVPQPWMDPLAYWQQSVIVPVPVTVPVDGGVVGFEQVASAPFVVHFPDTELTSPLPAPKQFLHVVSMKQPVPPHVEFGQK